MQNIYSLIKQRTGQTWVAHIKDHQRDESPECYWNNKVNSFAKQAALLTLPEGEVSLVITQAQGKEQTLTLHLAILQEGDEEIQNLKDLG